MKLWQKTSLICIAILLVVVTICSAVLLFHCKNSILELTYSHAKDRQRGLASSFGEMAGYYLAEGDSQALETSLVSYCFSRFADSFSVLMRGNETLCSGVSVNPRALLPLPENESAVKIAEQEIDGRNVLIVGSLVTVRNTPYAVYVIEDISTTYNSIASLAWIFAAVSLACILIGAGCIALIMRRSTRPLTVLANTAQQIADGNYSIRADVHTKDEIGTLAGDFNLMAEAVEAHIEELIETAERQKLFIGGVTHEFKTPLTALLLHARMLRRANMSEDERDNSLAHIEAQCEWLERLVQTLLKLITLERNIELKPCAIDMLFDGVRQNTQKKPCRQGCLTNHAFRRWNTKMQFGPYTVSAHKPCGQRGKGIQCGRGGQAGFTHLFKQHDTGQGLWPRHSEGSDGAHIRAVLHGGQIPQQKSGRQRPWPCVGQKNSERPRCGANN